MFYSKSQSAMNVRSTLLKRTHVGMAILLVSNAFQSWSQDWSHRHAFAKSYWGLSLHGVPAMEDGLFEAEGESVQIFDRSSFVSPAVNIGATHFWGHADFYVAINTVPLKIKEDNVVNRIGMGTFTGLRVYPWAVGDNKIRPYLGYKFSPWRYRQGDTPTTSYKTTRIKGMIDAGLGLATDNGYFTLDVSKLLRPDFETYLSRTDTSPDRWPEWTLSVGLNLALETTSVAANPVNKALNKELPLSNGKGLFFAAGPSSAFPVASSSYITEERPYLDDQSFPIIFPDVALGWHFSKADAVVAVSQRTMTQKRSAYDFEQVITRNSTILEAYKFFGDYHGFVPYLGAGISRERIGLEEWEAGDQITDVSFDPTPWYMVFGWDIRPSEKGDFWVLRTNLRIPPRLQLEHGEANHKLSLQHMEFNFIQLVVYPQRWRRARELSKDN